MYTPYPVGPLPYTVNTVAHLLPGFGPPPRKRYFHFEDDEYFTQQRCAQIRGNMQRLICYRPMQNDPNYMERYYTVEEEKAVDGMLVPHGKLARAMQRSRDYRTRAKAEEEKLGSRPSQPGSTSVSNMEAKNQGDRGRELLARRGVDIPVDARAQIVASTSKVCMTLLEAEHLGTLVRL